MSLKKAFFQCFPSAPVAKRENTPTRNLPLLLPAGRPLPAQRSRSRPTGPVAPPDTVPCASHRLHPSLHRDGRASGHQRALDRPLEQEAFHRAVLPEGQPALAVHRLAAGGPSPRRGRQRSSDRSGCLRPACKKQLEAGRIRHGAAVHADRRRCQRTQPTQCRQQESEGKETAQHEAILSDLDAGRGAGALLDSESRRAGASGHGTESDLCDPCSHGAAPLP